MLHVVKYKDYADSSLLEILARGEQAAFEALYNRYHGGIYNYLFKFTKSATQTEDLMHDVFLKIWEMREQLKISSSFSSYLYRAARNTSIDYLNQMALHYKLLNQSIFRVGQADNNPTAEGLYQWRQYHAMLEKAIASLSKQRRKAFIFCRQEGKTYEEAASLMGISRHTLKEYLVDAVKSIKQYLLQYGDITHFPSFTFSIKN